MRKRIETNTTDAYFARPESNSWEQRSVERKLEWQCYSASTNQTHFEKIVSIMGVKFMFDQFNAYFEDHSLRPISSERVSTILPEIMKLSIFQKYNVSTL